MENAFSKGFFPRYLGMSTQLELTDLSRPRPWQYRGWHTIESYICHFAANQHCTLGKKMYLIDLKEIGGIITEPPYETQQMLGSQHGSAYMPQDWASILFPITQEVYSLNTTAPVPGEDVVGMVIAPISVISTPATRLKLYANSDYKHGEQGVKAIVDLFNGESDWVMVL